jgi:hypothetical protein
MLVKLGTRVRVHTTHTSPGRACTRTRCYKRWETSRPLPTSTTPWNSSSTSLALSRRKGTPASLWRGFDDAEDTTELLYEKWIDVPRMLKDNLQELADKGDELDIDGLAKVNHWENNPNDDLPDTGGALLAVTPTAPPASSTSKHSIELVSC